LPLFCSWEKEAKELDASKEAEKMTKASVLPHHHDEMAFFDQV
jgi:hypothetical protein